MKQYHLKRINDTDARKLDKRGWHSYSGGKIYYLQCAYVGDICIALENAGFTVKITNHPDDPQDFNRAVVWFWVDKDLPYIEQVMEVERATNLITGMPYNQAVETFFAERGEVPYGRTKT